MFENVGIAGNVVSAIVFWSGKNETFTATTFLLICLAVLDNIVMSLYYLFMGMVNTCIFYDTCQYYMKVLHADSKACIHQIAEYAVVNSCVNSYSHLDILLIQLQHRA